MIETADSSKINNNCTMINKLIIYKESIGPVFPSKVISKCPAIILAERRIARVPGRIIFLIVSIKTIKGISTGGVPWGTKWANIWVVLLIHPNNMKVSHRGSANLKVNTMCLVLVKI